MRNKMRSVVLPMSLTMALSGCGLMNYAQNRHNNDRGILEQRQLNGYERRSLFLRNQFPGHRNRYRFGQPHWGFPYEPGWGDFEDDFWNDQIEPSDC